MMAHFNNTVNKKDRNLKQSLISKYKANLTTKIEDKNVHFIFIVAYLLYHLIISVGT
ncbi:hypothetical protein [Hanamia caeni]|uniref:hypothetical protein n=1 Tax=Hanamia caeni TaxID=2294116 RepID=UPI00131433BE|nr:hypothetical protein [Hanamia caeni]